MNPWISDFTVMREPANCGTLERFLLYFKQTTGERTVPPLYPSIKRPSCRAFSLISMAAIGQRLDYLRQGRLPGAFPMNLILGLWCPLGG